MLLGIQVSGLTGNRFLAGATPLVLPVRSGLLFQGMALPGLVAAAGLSCLTLGCSFPVVSHPAGPNFLLMPEQDFGVTASHDSERGRPSVRRELTAFVRTWAEE